MFTSELYPQQKKTWSACSPYHECVGAWLLSGQAREPMQYCGTCMKLSESNKPTVGNKDNGLKLVQHVADKKSNGLAVWHPCQATQIAQNDSYSWHFH